MATQLGDSDRHRIERLVMAITCELKARSSGTDGLAVRVNVDYAFNTEDIAPVYAICAWISLRMARLWFAMLGFGM